jgi:hypothetical protein
MYDWPWLPFPAQAVEVSAATIPATMQSVRFAFI